MTQESLIIGWCNLPIKFEAQSSPEIGVYISGVPNALGIFLFTVAHSGLALGIFCLR